LLHLQRVIDLSGVSADPNSSSARATVPAKKPVRQQPEGLKMRFLPIGFGSGKAGRIGSGTSSDSSSTESTSDKEMDDDPAEPERRKSSASKKSESSSDSSEDESSSGPDVETTDAPILSSKPVTKSKGAKEIPITAGGLKRKHGEGNDIKSKHSSSKSTISIDGRQLKRMKTKQDESRSIAGSQSMSTEAPKPKASQTPTLSSPIRPPNNPQLSKPSSSALLLPSSDLQSAVKSAPIPPSQIIRPPLSTAPSVSTPRKSNSETPSKNSKIKLSLEDQIKAIDPNLTGEERKQEVKRLRRNESSRISKAKNREPISRLIDGAKGSEAMKSSPAILPTKHLLPISQAMDNSIAQLRSTTNPATHSKEKKDKKKREVSLSKV